jgi:pimeloyl-ACP methyl ester carboxylesterase
LNIQGAVACLVLSAAGCVSHAPPPDSRLAEKMLEELARDAPIAVAEGSALAKLGDRHFIFVAGFLHEAIPGYFTDNAHVAHDELGAATSIIFPSSRQGLEDDVALIRSAVLASFAADGKPVVLFGHSKGGAGALLTVLRDPGLMLTGVVDRVIVVQGAIGGSPIADSITPENPVGILPVRFAGLDSLKRTRARALFDAALSGLDATLTDDERAWLANRVFYVRSKEKVGQVAFELALTHAYLGQCGTGENDGMLLTEDMKRDDFGVDLGVLKGDHGALTVSSFLANSSRRERRAFTRALLREVFERPDPERPR